MDIVKYVVSTFVCLTVVGSILMFFGSGDEGRDYWLFKADSFIGIMLNGAVKLCRVVSLQVAVIVIILGVIFVIVWSFNTLFGV